MVSLFSSHQVGVMTFCIMLVIPGQTIWPILVNTTSLPPKIRMDAENIMVAALWLGPCKPPMDILLRSTLSIDEEL